MKDGVEVYGGFAGAETQLGQRDWVQHVTTLSGDIGVPGDSRDNSYEVVSSLSLNASARLDGFTITAGYAEGFNGDFYLQDGGMGNGYDSSPTLTNLIFSSNTGRYGAGGMDNEYGGSPTLTNVTFSSNFAGSGGGGMYNSDSSPTLTNVTFSSNSGRGYGGGWKRQLQFADADQRHLQQQLRHRRRRRVQLLQFADADQRHLQQQLRRRLRRRHV